MASLKVLICGAGCVGPALAFWLSRAGHHVTVVERASELRSAGAQIDLREQGIQVARRMGLLEAIRSRTVDEAGFAMVDASGNVLGTIMANKSGQGAQLVTSEFEIMRGDFVQLMYDETAGHPNVQYVFGMSVERHEQKERSVVAHFSDGSSEEFDILVGADGQGSRVRSSILPEGAGDVYKHFGIYAAYFFIPRVVTDTNVARACAAVGGRMIMRRSHSPTESHVLFFARGDSPEMASLHKAPLERQKEIFYERFKDVGSETDRYLEGLKATDNFYCQEIVQVRTDTWRKGRVVLLGDAAHAPSPFSGFGLSAGLVGAYVLAGELCRTPDDPDQAFKNYEETVRPFVEGVQNGVNLSMIGVGMPMSWLGVAVIQLISRVVLTLRLPALFARFSSEDRNGWSLPDYPELAALVQTPEEK